MRAAHVLPRLTRACWLLALLAVPVSGPASAGSPTVGSKEIRQLVEASARAELERSPLAREAERVEVSVGALDSRLSLAHCSEPIHTRVDLSRGNSRVNARVSCEAPSPWSIYVPVELRVFREVVVSTRALQRGDRVQEDDVILEQRDVLAPGTPALTRLEEAIGYNLRRNVGAGATLTGSSVELPLLVRRGDRISLNSRVGGISVSAGAEALEDGRSGERIRVRNLASERIVEATVTERGQVQSP